MENDLDEGRRAEVSLHSLQILFKVRSQEQLMQKKNGECGTLHLALSMQI